MTKNKGSVVNAHRNLLAKAQTLSPTSEHLQFLGTVLHVIKKNSHKETNQLLARLEKKYCIRPIHIFRK